MEKAGVEQATREPVEVPREWRERGFSGRYHQRGAVPGDLAAALLELGLPCPAPRDRGWLVLAVEVDEKAGTGDVLMVRLDALAQLDLSAKRPGPGAYREPG